MRTRGSRKGGASCGVKANRKNSRRIRAWKLACVWGVYQPEVLEKAEIEICLERHGAIRLRPIYKGKRGPAVVISRGRLEKFLRGGSEACFPCLRFPGRRLSVSTAGNGREIIFLHFPEEANGGKYRTFSKWIRSSLRGCS